MKSLATNYRPKSFEEVISQKSIIDILKKQIETGKFKNSYIFCGASGCGKTTVARIFSNEINKNQGSPIEIDAASNSGVDNVRKIIDDANERAIDCEYKIYIIDEAHSLSSQAWQAFLKCIEEPPKYTIFIFCTTEKNKIPETIKNRCMTFNFTLIPFNLISERLQVICSKEEFKYDLDACNYLARISHGCLREAISLLDQISDYSKDINLENIFKVLGRSSDDLFFNLVDSFIDGNIKYVISAIDDIYSLGEDLRLFLDNFIVFCLNIEKYILFKTVDVTIFPSFYKDKLNKVSNFSNSIDYYNYVIKNLLQTKQMIRMDTDPKSTITIKFIEIARCQ